MSPLFKFRQQRRTFMRPCCILQLKIISHAVLCLERSFLKEPGLIKSYQVQKTVNYRQAKPQVPLKYDNICRRCTESLAPRKRVFSGFVEPGTTASAILRADHLANISPVGH